GDIEPEERDSAVMLIPIPASCILKAVYGVATAEAVPLITGVEITAKLHHPLVPLPQGASYLGFIFARGDSPAAVEEAIRRAHSLLKFDIRRDIPVLKTTTAALPRCTVFQLLNVCEFNSNSAFFNPIPLVFLC